MKSLNQDSFLYKEKTPAILAYILTIGVLISLISLFIFEIPKENKEIITQILTTLGTVWIAAMAYYHGSSSGSKQKDEQIKNLMEK